MKNSLRRFSSTILLLTAVGASLGLMAGCQSSKPGGLFSEVDAKPPTAMELRLFKAVTNYEDQVSQVTNVVRETNAAGAVASHEVVTQETKRVAVTQLTPGTGSNTIVSVLTGLAGLFGWGGVVGVGSTGAITTYLNRRNKALAGAKISTLEDVSGVLAQNIETLRQVIATTPQGQQLGVAVKQYLMEHQNNAGLIQQVTDIVGTSVNQTAAAESAKEIQALLAQFQATQVPARTATAVAPAPTGI